MKKNLHTFPVGVLATLIFFVIGYFYSFRFAWLAFLAVPIFRWFADSSQTAYADSSDSFTANAFGENRSWNGTRVPVDIRK
ncbi:hypothetical protein OfM1_20790 [Lactovum odontotermitis]